METSIDSNLKHLSIQDDEFDKAIEIFTNQNLQLDTTNTLTCLLLGSRSVDTSAKLFDLLQENPNKFLKTLNTIGDKRGNIIVNILQLQSESERNHWILQILNTIKIYIKNSNNIQVIEVYLSIYLNLIVVFEICVPEHLQILLTLLTPENEDSDIEATVLYIVVRNLENEKSSTLESISSFFDYILDTRSGVSTFLNLIKSLEMLFPIVPSVCIKYYTNNQCKEAISEYATKISPSSLEIPHNLTLGKCLLKLVSSSAIAEECRKFTADNYINLLVVGKDLEFGKFTEMKLLAVLCIIKLWSFVSINKDKSVNVTIDELYEINIDYLTKHHGSCDDYCIESLAYLTLNGSIRNKMRLDVLVIEKLISMIKHGASFKSDSIKSDSIKSDSIKSDSIKSDSIKSDSIKSDSIKSQSAINYGLLLVISNLMKIKENQVSQEKRTREYLKSMATPNSNDKTKENQQEIHDFNKSLLLDHNIIELVSKFPQNSEQLVSIIYSISTNQLKIVRQELVKQGALNILLDYLISQSNIKQSSKPEVKLQAIRALAKILIMVNPSLAFNKHSILSCIPFLIELLGSNINEYSPGLKDSSDEEITSLDKYEALLSLTNISSIDDRDNLKDILISKIFNQYLDNFILDSDTPQIQLASWELISNLISKPKLLVKFFNTEDQQALKRLDLLIKLLESKDLQLQIILGGLLANATSEFDMIPQVLIQTPKLKLNLVECIIRIFESQPNDTDLILRLCCVLLDLVYSAANLGEITYFKTNSRLKESMNKVLRTQKNKQVMEVLLEIIKVLK